ncbi:Peptidoglycan D,D-transpeptidase MrdA [Oligella ureolytica]
MFQGTNYASAGKTGTAQVFSLRGAKYNARNLDKRLHDHALYMGFAPMENPTIALAVIVENGGWGSTVAAPIARKVFDYWLADDVQNRNRQSYMPNFLNMEGDATEAVSPDIEIPEAPTNMRKRRLCSLCRRFWVILNLVNKRNINLNSCPPRKALRQPVL